MVEPVYNVITDKMYISDKTYSMIDQNRIVSMQYSTFCTGTPTLDKYNTAIGSGVNLYFPNAEAQRFVPTSRCLENVILNVKKVATSTTIGLNVEIRPDSGGVPSGEPLGTDRLGYIVIPASSIPTIYTDMTATLNTILPNLNPVWIVTCLEYYDPNSTDPNTYYRFDGGTGTGTSTEYESFKIGTASWVQTADTNYFKTNKRTYTTCAPMTVSMTIP